VHFLLVWGIHEGFSGPALLQIKKAEFLRKKFINYTRGALMRKWWEIALNQVRYVRRHSGYRPGVSEFRLVAWVLFVLVREAVTVRFGSLGFQLSVPAELRGQSKTAYLFREDYEPELRHLHKVLMVGDVFVDVGAHYGVYSVAGAQIVGETGAVISVEPSPHCFPILSSNTAHLAQIRIAKVALGSSETQGRLIDHPDKSRMWLDDSAEGLDGALVEIRTLDSLLESYRLPRVDFIKIDVEGRELDVLKGAEKTIAKFSPFVLFENLPGLSARLGIEEGACQAFLASRGYLFGRLESEPTSSRRLPLQGSPNIFAFHPQRGI
jgi:FkbM family methyltransferase